VVRQAVIECVRERETSVAALRAESSVLGKHPGRAELTALLDLVAGGCESELEIWGVTHVLPGRPLVPPPVQHHRIRLPDGRGGPRGGRPGQGGGVVLRFGYARLIDDAEGSMREIIAVVRRRLVHR
jgi:hypothetical protein